MVLSLPLLGASLGRLAIAQTDFLGWAFATTSSLSYGVGTLISGSPYLALVRESAPQKKQGFAISVVEIGLITFFAITGIVFSIWMKEYEEPVFWQMVLATMVIGGFFWVFAIAGEERRQAKFVTPHQDRVTGNEELRPGFIETIKKIWADPRTRGFFYFLALATLSAWGQDAILEPFGAEVFDLPVERTTRLNSFWQAATVVTLVGGAYLWRKRPPELQRRIAQIGLVTMALGMILLGAAALGGTANLVVTSLIVFGGGFGVYTFGGVSLMAVMASSEEAGAYLGLWSIAVLVTKGLGTFLGGAMRDILLLNMELSAATSYGPVFILEAVGLVGAAVILARLDILGFAREVGRVPSRTEAQIASAD
jgi:BCD family chlorophyll transporter-like MFS transporter